MKSGLPLQFGKKEENLEQSSGRPPAVQQAYHDPDLTAFESFYALREFYEKGPEGAESFEDFERELGRRTNAWRADLTAAKLARYDVEAQVIEVDGVEYRRCLEKEPKKYLSASGPITVERNLYRPSGGGKSVCALELRAGIVCGRYTPVLAEQVCYAMGHMTSEETAALFGKFAVDGPSSSSCDRIPKGVSQVWERHREAWESALREQETVPAEATVMAVSLDGVMVPDKEGQREAKAKREERKRDLSKATGGPAGYREVGCGTVSLFDDEGNRLDTVRYGRAPEYKKRTLTEELDAEVASILAVSNVALVALADGAEENWRYFSGPLWETAIKIVDFGHACEHLKAGLSAFYGAKGAKGRAEYERLKVILKDEPGGVDQVIHELLRLERKQRQGKKRKRRELVRKERKYFENQRERMDYAHYQELGLPIGSGVVEAACKTLATQRLKRSGMSWGEGKQPILTIRSLQQSGRWDRAWRLIAGEFQQTVLVVRKQGGLKSLSHPGYAAA